MANKLPVHKDTEHTFETAIGRLENIVETMESDKMPLEELLGRYEEGIKLVKVCQEKLETAEKRIDIITRNAAGKPQTAEFESSVSLSPPESKSAADAASGISLF